MLRRHKAERFIEGIRNGQCREQAWAREQSRRLNWAKCALLTHPSEVAQNFGDVMVKA